MRICVSRKIFENIQQKKSFLGRTVQSSEKVSQLLIPGELSEDRLVAELGLLEK